MNKELAPKITIAALEKVAAKYGFRIFKGSKDYDLNIWQIRSNNQKAGSFDDIQAVFWKYNGVWVLNLYPITCDPSDVALIAKKNPLGVAIVKPGQYSKAWRFGLHQGKYKALVQRGTLTVIRDFNKDNILDWNEPKVYDGKIKYQKGSRTIVEYKKNNVVIHREETGTDFGINCHRASTWQILERIGLYSEGCTVHQHPKRYDEFISIVEDAVQIWGEDFTPTFITEQMLDLV